MIKAAAKWRVFISEAGAGRLWGFIWLLALAVPFLPGQALLALSSLSWFSASALAPGRHHGCRLMRLALGFLLFWAGLLSAAGLFYSSSLRPVLNLSAWLALGLNLMLAKTPLELALFTGRLMAPMLGRIAAQKLALSLALLARLIPRLLASAWAIKIVLDRRASHLSFVRRLSLWSKTLIRDAFGQSEELARTLVKRWPW